MSKKDMLGIAVRKLVTLNSSVLGVVCDLLEKIQDPEWEIALKRFLRKEHPWVIPVCDTFKVKVVVDYNLSLAEMISAGKYDWVNKNITQENFPIEGKGKVEKEITLFHFNKLMTSEQVIAEMEKAGYRPAKIEEFLALGAQYPKLQKKFHIIGLGSLWINPGGVREVPCLHWSAVKHNLNLHWFENSWNEYCRFAAVCK